MRKTLVILTAIALVALVSAPGLAKVGIVPTEASMTGPGIDGDIDLNQGQATALIDQTEGWDVFYGGVVDFEVEAPAGELGPRYTITYVLEISDHAKPHFEKTGTFIQHFYPYADEGPALFIPHGQKLEVPGSSDITSAWASLSTLTMDHLEAFGLPSELAISHSASTVAIGGDVSAILAATATLVLLVVAGGVLILIRGSKPRGFVPA